MDTYFADPHTAWQHRNPPTPHTTTVLHFRFENGVRRCPTPARRLSRGGMPGASDCSLRIFLLVLPWSRSDTPNSPFPGSPSPSHSTTGSATDCSPSSFSPWRSSLSANLSSVNFVPYRARRFPPSQRSAASLCQRAFSCCLTRGDLRYRDGPSPPPPTSRSRSEPSPFLDAGSPPGCGYSCSPSPSLTISSRSQSLPCFLPVR